MSKQKKKSSLKRILTGIVLVVLFSGSGYFALRYYYESADFICGTWINGIYCAGRAVEEVEAELLSVQPQDQFQVFAGKEDAVILNRREFGELPGQNFSVEEDYRYSYADSLRDISSTQIPGNWVVDTFRSRRYEVEPAICYTLKQDELLEYLKEKVPVIKAGSKITTPEVCIEKTPEGYVLQDEKKHHLDTKLAVRVIYEAVVAGETAVDLEEKGCFSDIPYNAADQETLKLWKKIEDFQDCRIVYKMGEDREPVDASVVSKWITLDQERNFVLDQDDHLVLNKEAIREYIDKLADQYDTYGKTRQFQATRGDKVTIEGGTYGNEIDRKAENAYLTEAFLQKKEEDREPEYKRKAWAQGKNDIGDTYIEIDMTQQKMYYYVAGNCEIDTSIVTGDMMKRRNTPAAVCYVYGKQRNRVLKGPGYAAHVNFWMPVKGGIGIHDAKWRKEFGGDIYKTNGSHGCINTPYEQVEKLYDLVEIGTPVVMFY